jgi:hypothetical protein
MIEIPLADYTAHTTSLSAYSQGHDGGSLIVDAWTGQKAARTIWQPLGKTFTMTRLRARICTGSYNLTTFATTPCPHRIALEGKSTTCSQCFREIGFNPFFYNVSREAMSDRQRAYNERPHCVYLAYFGGETVKVGISSEARLSIRLREQGSWVAVKLASCGDAWAARAIEYRLSKLPQFAEIVRSDRKRRLLATMAASNSAKSIFEAAISRAASELGAAAAGMELMDLRQSYGDFQSAEGAVDGSDAKPYVLSGKALAMIGSALVMENRTRRILFDIGNMISHRFQWRASVEPVEAGPLQQNLFGG